MSITVTLISNCRLVKVHLLTVSHVQHVDVFHVLRINLLHLLRDEPPAGPVLLVVVVDECHQLKRPDAVDR